MRLNLLVKLIVKLMVRSCDMLNIIRGANGWQFIAITGSDLDEAFDFYADNPKKTSLFLDSMKCRSDVIERIYVHKKAHIIRSIHLLNEWADISLLEKFIWLEKISLGFEKSSFNFSKLTNLLSVGGVWSKKWTGLENCTNLKEFSASNFQGSISNIPQLGQLSEIILFKPNFVSLDGIELAKEISVLEISNAKNLCDISQVSKCDMTLKKLMFDACRKIVFLDELDNIINLEEIILSDCGKIKSISFIKNMKNLRILSVFGTRVIDNDLSPCVDHPNLREFRCDSFNGYTPSIKKVTEILDNLIRC